MSMRGGGVAPKQIFAPGRQFCALRLCKHPTPPGCSSKIWTLIGNRTRIQHLMRHVPETAPVIRDCRDHQRLLRSPETATVTRDCLDHPRLQRWPETAQYIRDRRSHETPQAVKMLNSTGNLELKTNRKRFKHWTMISDILPDSLKDKSADLWKSDFVRFYI